MWSGSRPAMLHDAHGGRTVVVCGQGPAPAGATIAHYRGHLGLDIIPGTGLLPACIPGTFETYMLILRDFGTMSLADVLTPAIAYARNGYPLVERACAMIATVARLFSEHWPTSAAVYLPRGRVPAPGLLFTSVRHAQTYERILREGSGRRDRRHGTHRYHRQGRQYVHRYAIGRLAAVLPVIPDLGWPLGSRRVCPARWSRASGRARRFRLV